MADNNIRSGLRIRKRGRDFTTSEYMAISKGISTA